MATKNQLVVELKEAEKLLVEGEAHLKGILDKLAEIESQQSAAHVAERNLPVLLERRADLKASVALGETGKQAELDSLSKEIDQVQLDLANHAETVAGLNRRAAETQSSLTPLRSRRGRLVEEIIRSEAEQIQAEYMVHAKGLVSKFKQLQALARIHKDNSMNADPIGMGGEHQYLSIPLFKLSASEQHPNDPGNWPEWNVSREVKCSYGVSPDSLSTEKRRLAGMGVEVI